MKYVLLLTEKEDDTQTEVDVTLNGTHPGYLVPIVIENPETTDWSDLMPKAIQHYKYKKLLYHPRKTKNE